MHLTLRYFARLREQFNCEQETLTLTTPLSAQTLTVQDLIVLLIARGGVWAAELDGNRVFRVAVDQQLVPLTHPLHHGAEVAIFPPVTGG